MASLLETLRGRIAARAGSRPDTARQAATDTRGARLVPGKPPGAEDNPTGVQVTAHLPHLSGGSAPEIGPEAARLPDTAAVQPPAPAPGIGGVGMREMAWVRVTTGQDVSSGSDGIIRLSGHGQADGLREIGRLLEQPHDDVASATPNFRNTVHGALNHHVSDHAYGSWGGKEVVVIAPLDGMIRANGAPTGFGTVDTYWAVGPGASLRVPGAVVVSPDRGELAAGELYRQVAPGRIAYATSFDDGREASALEGLSERGRLALQGRIDGLDNGAGALSMSREARGPEVSAAVDGELGRIAKLVATHSAVRGIGPVMAGGMWSWGGRDHRAETEALAASIGSRVQQHNGSGEDKAVDLMGSGRAADVVLVEDVSPATKAVAAFLVADPVYAAFATARSADQELQEAALDADGSGLSPAALERLARMVEAAARGIPPTGIGILDRDGRPTYGFHVPGPAGNLGTEASLKGNVRIRTLLRTSSGNEVDPALRARLAAAASYVAAHCPVPATGAVPPPLPGHDHPGSVKLSL